MTISDFFISRGAVDHSATAVRRFQPGMIPSVRASRYTASSASASEAATYSARFESASAACSGRSRDIPARRKSECVSQSGHVHPVTRKKMSPEALPGRPPRNRAALFAYSLPRPPASHADQLHLCPVEIVWKIPIRVGSTAHAGNDRRSSCFSSQCLRACFAPRSPNENRAPSSDHGCALRARVPRR